MHWLTIVCLSTSLSSMALGATDSLPEQFYGRFELERSEKFDEYLVEMGVGWFKRKIISMANVAKVFTKGENGRFDFDNLTTKKDLHYKNIRMGETFDGEGIDSTTHKVTFRVDNGWVYEKHVPTDPNGEAKEDEYAFNIQGDYLVQVLEKGGVTAKRYFKRCPC